MKQWNRYLPIALFLGFLLVALVAFFQSKPTTKNARIYQAVQHYSPYYLDKRLGGLTILSREDETFKEKPANMTLYKELERLERNWGKSHLRIEGDTLLILDDNASIKARIPLKTDEERQFVHHYYGV